MVHLHLTTSRLRSYNLLIIFDRIHICKTLKHSNQSDNSLRVLSFDRLIVDWSFENMNPIAVQCGMSLDDSVSSEDKKKIDTTKLISIDLTLSLTNTKRTFSIFSVADEGCCNCCIVVDCILTVLES